MNSAEFKMVRRLLGITADEVAAACGVTLRTARRWEATHQPPADAVAWMNQQLHRAHTLVQDLLDQSAANRSEPLHVPIYRTDEGVTQGLGDNFTKEQHMAIVGIATFMADVHDWPIAVDFDDDQPKDSP